MAQILIGQFDDFESAQAAAGELRSLGIAQGDMEIFALNAPGQHDQTPIGGDEDEDRGARKGDDGALTGAAVGGAAGLALGAAAIPVVGPIAVAAGLADRCEVQFAYAIGHPEPVSVSVDTFCTGKVDEEKLERAIWEVFNFKPAEIIKQLNLLRPIYRNTTNYGHFGRIDDLDALTWERTDKADALKQAVK